MVCTKHILDYKPFCRCSYFTLQRIALRFTSFYFASPRFQSASDVNAEVLNFNEVINAKIFIYIFETSLSMTKRACILFSVRYIFQKIFTPLE